MEEQVQKVIGVLRHLRVRQGDFMPVLECLIAQSTELTRIAPQGPLHEAAMAMRARAFEIHRIGKAVPRFVLEDLVDECIERLETSLATPIQGGHAGAANG